MRDFSWIDFNLLLWAARWTVLLSLVAFFGGGLVGALIATLRVSRSPVLRRFAQIYILVLQGTPLLMQIFLAYFGLALLGVDLPAAVSATLALTTYASAFFAEIWRGTIEAIPRTQWEGSSSLGLTRGEQLRYVIVPQAMRIALAPTVGFAVQIVKNTSLTAIIGFTELARASQLINNATFQPFLVFGCAALIYFAMCFPLSVLSRKLERRLHVGRAGLARQ
jgi:polar amino acid transport system permease protein